MVIKNLMGETKQVVPANSEFENYVVSKITALLWIAGLSNK